MSSVGRDPFRKKRLKAEYRQLREEVVEILLAADPAGIGANLEHEEYSPEAGSILARLREANSVEDVRRIVHEEFVYWFGPLTAGSETSYTDISDRIWEAWQKSELRQPGCHGS